jgi:hypothetical protein
LPVPPMTVPLIEWIDASPLWRESACSLALSQIY